MRSIMRSVSTNSLLNDQRWPLFVGLNCSRHWSITRALYMNEQLYSPAIKKGRNINVYYLSGLVKNKRQLHHINEVCQRYSANLYWIDTLQQQLQHKLNDTANIDINPFEKFVQNNESKDDDRNIVISQFEGVEYLQNALNNNTNKSNSIDLILSHPYFGDFKDINREMSNYFLLAFKKQVLNIYKSSLNSSPSLDLFVQQIMLAKDLHSAIAFTNNSSIQNEEQQNINGTNGSTISINNVNNKNSSSQIQSNIQTKSLSVILSTKDDILFSKDKEIQSENFKNSVKAIYSHFDSVQKTQFVLNRYSPIMSLIWKDPVANALECILK